jgi:glyoxylase-like metal-dependent hydrolase (beta-lactamase superfamily II)
MSGIRMPLGCGAVIHRRGQIRREDHGIMGCASRLVRHKTPPQDYILPQLIDFTGADYGEVNGEAEVLTGVLLIPPPGHTNGYQAVAVRSEDGTIVLAGQGT